LETPSRRAAAETPPASATAMNVCRSSMSNSAFLISRHGLPDYGTTASPKGTANCARQARPLAHVSRKTNAA
jgi:hypothetical protein